MTHLHDNSQAIIPILFRYLLRFYLLYNGILLESFTMYIFVILYYVAISINNI